MEERTEDKGVRFCHFAGNVLGGVEHFSRSPPPKKTLPDIKQKRVSLTANDVRLPFLGVEAEIFERRLAPQTERRAAEDGCLGGRIVGKDGIIRFGIADGGGVVEHA